MVFRRTMTAFTSLLCLFVTCLIGCVHHRVTTYLSQDHVFPNPTPAISIAVSVSSIPSEALLEREVKHKLVKLLTEKGYETADRHSANYELLASFGIDNGAERIGSRPVTNQGVTTYKTTSATVYSRMLRLTLVSLDAAEYGDPAQNDEAVCWSAITRSRGSSSDIRTMIDYLLVATMDYWGVDTGKEVKETLSKRDRRVHALDAP